MSLINNYQIDKINNNDSVETKTDLINLLDDDCLSIILSYLQPFELVETKKVSQRWNHLTELAWIFIKKFECTTPVFGYKNNWQLVNFNKLKDVILNGGRYLTHLTLKNLCGSEIVPLIRDHCHNLVRLELVLNKMDDIDFDNAFTKMNQLNYISINIHPKYHLINDELYGAIVSTLHSSISEIHLPSICDSDPYSYASFESIYFFYWMEKFDNLQALTLHYQIMGDTDISTILNYKTLSHLSLSYGVIENYLLIKLTNLIHLEYLDLSYVYDVDDRVVLNIANNCCKLKYLNLKKCSLVTGNSINKLAQLVDLEHLIVEELNLNENCIYNIANNCKNLKSLNISESKNVQKSDIMKIGELKFLEHLELCNLKSVDDDGLINIIHKCCNLKYLDIKRCSNLTKNALVEIKKLKNLETLIVTGVHDIDDEFISHLYNLKYLNCSESKVTDIGIKNVIKNCPSMEKLSVIDTKITVDSPSFAAQETNKRSTNIILTVEADDVINNRYEKISQTGSNVLFKIQRPHYENLNF
ncbi:hypothetical protein HCN44_002348 [Aphidius gifuensis]|uniref:F-box domain-containing protein n=1 Tax=Aphidius gifuensis TaxID=684658 RepID=A0A834Y2Y4_APHGI|nr:uncharacterized protein LOC122860747 [Aphidius gifuensis]KAF7996702.1 hypothetical protein HCN44_002348 [Aphidius gifuensis]